MTCMPDKTIKGPASHEGDRSVTWHRLRTRLLVLRLPAAGDSLPGTALVPWQTSPHSYEKNGSTDCIFLKRQDLSCSACAV